MELYCISYFICTFNVLTTCDNNYGVLMPFCFCCWFIGFVEQLSCMLYVR